MVPVHCTLRVNFQGLYRPTTLTKYVETILEGPSTQHLRTLVPKTIPLMVFGTRVLKFWELGPSGNGPELLKRAGTAVNHRVDRSPCFRRLFFFFFGGGGGPLEGGSYVYATGCLGPLGGLEFGRPSAEG